MTEARPPFIVALGEVLWDVFPTGRHLGGAPANFAVHCAQLGARAALISCVGNDALGREAVSALAARQVDTQWIGTHPTYPTGQVVVTLNEGHPEYDIVEGVAWDYILWCDAYEALAKKANAICFGTLAQRFAESRQTIQRMVDAASTDCLRVLDVNFRQAYHSADVVKQSLALANVVKLNHEEVAPLQTYVGGPTDTDGFLKTLLVRFQLQWVVLTLGKDGCCIYGPDDQIVVPNRSFPIVANTVGAGDAFMAAFVGHLLKGTPIAVCAEQANAVGGFVVTQESATPPLPSSYQIF